MILVVYSFVMKYILSFLLPNKMVKSLVLELGILGY